MGTGQRRKAALGFLVACCVIAAGYAIAVPAAQAEDNPPLPATTTTSPCLPPGSMVFGICQVHPTMAPPTTFGTTSTAPRQTIYIAVEDARTTTINESIEIDVLANDLLPVGYSYGSLNVTSEPFWGLATVQDSEFDVEQQIIEYVPDFGYLGNDSFHYETCVNKSDGSSGGPQTVCDTAVVLITVAGLDVPQSTTTTAPVTTTTVAELSPTTSGNESVAPTSAAPTSAAATSTTFAAVESADATSTSASVGATAALPRTGSSPFGAWIGLGVLATGVIIAFATRRRARQA